MCSVLVFFVVVVAVTFFCSPIAIYGEFNDLYTKNVERFELESGKIQEGKKKRILL